MKKNTIGIALAMENYVSLGKRIDLIINKVDKKFSPSAEELVDFSLFINKTILIYDPRIMDFMLMTIDKVFPYIESINELTSLIKETIDYCIEKGYF